MTSIEPTVVHTFTHTRTHTHTHRQTSRGQKFYRTEFVTGWAPLCLCLCVCVWPLCVLKYHTIYVYKGSYTTVGDNKKKCLTNGYVKQWHRCIYTIAPLLLLRFWSINTAGAYLFLFPRARKTTFKNRSMGHFLGLQVFYYSHKEIGKGKEQISSG